MNTKSLTLLAITVFFIPSAMAACNGEMNTAELTNCVFLESEGINYAEWKESFTNPPEMKKMEKGEDIAFIISTPSLRN